MVYTVYIPLTRIIHLKKASADHQHTHLISKYFRVTRSLAGGC